MGDTPTTVSALLDLVRKYGFEYFGVYYGKYRGIVTDNKDPEKLGRLKVNVPQVSGKNIMDTWAWPSGLVGGDDFGAFFIPPKGSGVWVTFENGDPNHPVWEGCHWARGKTPEVAKRATPDNRVFQTRNWIMEMDDQEGSEKFKITDRKSGNHFHFDSATGNMALKVTGDENTQTGGNRSRTVSGNSSETVSGNKNISCVNFSLSATGSSTMTFGSSTVTLSPSEISFSVGGHILVINVGGVHIDGREFLSHNHSGVDPGGGNTGGVN